MFGSGINMFSNPALKNLSDVVQGATWNNGEVPVYNSTTLQFEPGTPGGGGGSGIVALFDATGDPTYYTTIQSAINAASAGQTVQVLTSITETAATQVNLKNGVNVNLNGNTYTLNNAGTVSSFSDNNLQVDSIIYNGKIKREGGTYSSVNSLCIHVNSNLSDIKLQGVVCESSFGCTAYVEGKLTGGTFISGAGTISYRVSSQGKAEDAKIYAVSGARIDNSSSNIYCYATTGTAITISGTGEFNNLTGISAGNYGIFCNTAAKVNNSVGVSLASFGSWQSAASIFNNVVSYSSASIGLLNNVSGAETINCSIESAGNYGLSLTGIAKGCIVKSSASYGTRINDGEFYDGVSESTLNTSSGYAFFSGGTGLSGKVFNSVGKVANAGAEGIRCNSSGNNIFFGNNTFEGCTNILNTGTPGVLNLQINAPDATNNILVG